MWAAVLRSTSAFEMYRKRFQTDSPDRIVEFLVLDREFPRAFTIASLRRRDIAAAISGTKPGTFRIQQSSNSAGYRQI